MATRTALEKQVNRLQSARRNRTRNLAARGRMVSHVGMTALGVFASGSTTKNLKVMDVEADAIAGGLGLWRIFRGKSNEATSLMLGMGYGYVYRVGEKHPLKLFGG